ncbi:bacterial transcriptional activator domain-containing protein [Streptomyces sp. NPDC001793]|uniref:AfsR/SARP family transcriptional regulator n=1 Tax=Streptomyces sp. NPDC001793 TaxID=3154657 RepID=UPI00331F55C1
MNSSSAYLELLNAFEFAYAGRRIPLRLGGQRLLALLALQKHGVYRVLAGEQLWPDCTSSRAAANLRSALCQVRQIRPETVVDSVGQRLRLAPWVDVDLDRVRKTAQQVIDGVRPLPADCDVLVDELNRELLPGWPDDWLVLERERWDQVRLHALESLAQQLQAAQQYLPALQAALTAIAIDPIRETAHRIIVEIHLAEGNIACALKRYHAYRELLQQELEVAPSPQMARLVQEVISM